VACIAALAALLPRAARADGPKVLFVAPEPTANVSAGSRAGQRIIAAATAPSARPIATGTRSDSPPRASLRRSISARSAATRSSIGGRSRASTASLPTWAIARPRA
jgi:hypothetical protein